MDHDALVNDFALRSFRDMVDGDYIAARMACRAALLPQFLWASQQAVEKYLKCILLLNRIDAREAYHDLGKALDRIDASGKLSLDLTRGTKEFIDMLDQCGRYRYFEVSTVGFGAQLVTLDRAVWELRRYCTVDEEPRRLRLRQGFAAPRVRLENGLLREDRRRCKKSGARAAALAKRVFWKARTKKNPVAEVVPGA